MNRDIRDIQFSILNALCSETSSRIIISTNLRALGITDGDLDLAWKDFKDRGMVVPESMVVGDFRGADTDRYRLPNWTGHINDCVLCGRPVASAVLAEEVQNMVREVLGKAHAQCLFPETWPGELRFLPLGL